MLLIVQVINLVSRVTPRISTPIVLFTYYNPIMRRGAEKFCQDIKAAGAAGASAVLGCRAPVIHMEDVYFVSKRRYMEASMHM